MRAVLGIIGHGVQTSQTVLKACSRLICGPDDLLMTLQILPDEIDTFIR